jgi:hypothetical protein
MSLTACAAAPTATASKNLTDTCVFYSVLYDWQTLDDSNLVVWVPGKHDAYHLSLTTPLPGLKFALRLGFVDGTQDGRLCSFGRDEITIPDSSGGESATQRSTIRSIEHLTAGSLAQLEEKYQVKLKRESKRKAPPKVPDRETAQ